jgi:uncharacterized phiE125 gp8 family phage protein
MSYYPRRTGAPAVEPVSLSEALAHLREDSGVADDYISALISAARTACEERIERTLISTTWRVTMDSFPDAVVLFRPPVIAVQSVVYLDLDGVEQTLDAQDYIVDSVSEPGYVVPAPSVTWPDTQDRINAVWVNYTAGYGSTAADVPRPLRQWILLAVGEMYAMRNRSAERPAVPHLFVDGLLDPYKIMRF